VGLQLEGVAFGVCFRWQSGHHLECGSSSYRLSRYRSCSLGVLTNGGVRSLLLPHSKAGFAGMKGAHIELRPAEFV
jgi:hypothetical protein